MLTSSDKGDCETNVTGKACETNRRLSIRVQNNRYCIGRQAGRPAGLEVQRCPQIVPTATKHARQIRKVNLRVCSTLQCGNIYTGHINTTSEQHTSGLGSWQLTMKGNAQLQAFAAKWIKSALFCAITRRIVAIPHRRFGATYRYHLQGQQRLSRNVGTKLPLCAA